MVLTGSRVLPGTLMVFVPFHRLRSRRRRGAVIVAVPRTGDLARPEQWRDQEKRGKDACYAATVHDGA